MQEVVTLSSIVMHVFGVASRLLVKLIWLYNLVCITFCWQLKKRHALSLTSAPYSCRPCEKRGWHCNISDLAPYYPACFTDASLALLPYNMISKIIRHIFVKLFHGMCQSLEAISWVFSAFHFLFPPCSVIAMVCQHFPITVWNQFISANSIITCHFTISPVFHIYLPVMCICYYKENSRKSFIMLHNIVTFFEKLWRLILHILYTEVLSLNTKD